MAYPAIKYDLNELEQSYLKHNLVTVVKACLNIIKPKPRISIVKWAEENIILPDTFPIPGPFRIKNSPHLREPLEAIEDPEVRRVIMVGCSQQAKTLYYIIVWAYYVCNDPCAMLMGHPSDTDLKTFVTLKLEPVIEASPALRRLVAKKKRGNTDDSSTRMKKYIGGWTEIISLTSSKRTRQRTVRITFSDDIDVIDSTIATEGDPISNLHKRTTTFKYNSLNIDASVPHLEDTSRIWPLFLAGSMGYYNIKCPHCKVVQRFDEDNIVCDNDTDLTGAIINQLHETARIPCISCGYLFNESERIELLQIAFYVHEHPERKTVRSFHLGQASSTLTHLPAIAEERYTALKAEALGDDAKKESYVNGVKGFPYKRVVVKEVDAKILLDRREDYIDPQNPYIIPNGVFVITGGVDVQRGKVTEEGRLEYEVWGWGYGEECWILDKRIFNGPVEKKNEGAWLKLRKYQEQVYYTRHDGLKMNVKRIHYDSGFARDAVYDFCARKAHKGHFATKGANQYGANLLPKKASVVNGNKTVLLIIGTQFAKETFFGRLEEVVDDGPKRIHHTKAYCDVNYFEQVTAEVAEEVKQGYTIILVYKRKKGNPPNEALDLWILNFTALKALNPNWERLKVRMASSSPLGMNGESADDEKEKTLFDKPDAGKSHPTLDAGSPKQKNPVKQKTHKHKRAGGNKIVTW